MGFSKVYFAQSGAPDPAPNFPDLKKKGYISKRDRSGSGSKFDEKGGSRNI